MIHGVHKAGRFSVRIRRRATRRRRSGRIRRSRRGHRAAQLLYDIRVIVERMRRGVLGHLVAHLWRCLQPAATVRRRIAAYIGQRGRRRKRRVGGSSVATAHVTQVHVGGRLGLLVLRVVGICLAAAVLGARILEPDLEHPLGQARLLGQLLEIFGVRIVVQLEVGLHHAQLVMLKRGAHAFLALGCGCGGRCSRCYGRHRVIVATRLPARIRTVVSRRGTRCCCYRVCNGVGCAQTAVGRSVE